MIEFGIALDLAMKSKKVKEYPNSSRPSEEDQATHRNAFSFIKNRFFSTQPHKPLPTESHKNTNELITEKPLLNSLDESFIPEHSTSSTKRPLSMVEYNEPVSVPSRRNSTTDISQRSSQIILKEGYLFKKKDFKPFHKQNKLERGWKLYRVILRGHKLYLFKVTSESPLRSLFPVPPHHLQPPQLKQLNSNNSLSSYQSLSFSLSNSSITSTLTPVTLNLVKSEFDKETQKVFFPENSSSMAQGMVFTEVHPTSLQPKGQHYLISFKKTFYICHRHDSVWKISQSAPIKELQVNWVSSGLFNVLSNTYSTGNYELGKTWISHLCDDTQRPGIIYRNNNTVQGGTIHALIHELLYNDKDGTFVHVFLLTYTLFTTGSQVLTELKSVLTNQLEPRLLNVFTIWCEQFSLDVMGDMATGMIDILDSMHDSGSVKELVLKTVNDNATLACEQKKHSIGN